MNYNNGTFFENLLRWYQKFFEIGRATSEGLATPRTMFFVAFVEQFLPIMNIHSELKLIFDVSFNSG